MSIAVVNSEPLTYDDDWLPFLEAAPCNDSAAANNLIFLLYNLYESNSRGAEGVKQVNEALLEGIRLAYLYTEEHKAAFELYMLSLTGHLKPQDEPLQLINAAIEHGRTEIERASVREARKSRKRGKHAFK